MPLDERSEKRPDVALPARCRVRSLTAQLTISDLTLTGCRLTGLSMRVHDGERILICPEGIQPIPSYVVWARANAVGVRFEHPLHPAVGDHLIKLYPASASNALTGRPMRHVS